MLVFHAGEKVLHIYQDQVIDFTTYQNCCLNEMQTKLILILQLAFSKNVSQGKMVSNQKRQQAECSFPEHIGILTLRVVTAIRALRAVL